MFEGVINRLYEIEAPLGANTHTPVAGEFALYEGERYAESGNNNVVGAIGVAMLKFMQFAKNDKEATQKFKEVLDNYFKDFKGDNWQLADEFKALRGMWLAEAKILSP